MVRASWVLKRQLMVAWAVLRSVTRAWTLPPESFLVGESLSEAGAGQYAELDFRHIQPTPVLGGVVELQSRLAIRRASAAGNASYSDAMR